MVKYTKKQRRGGSNFASEKSQLLSMVDNLKDQISHLSESTICNADNSAPSMDLMGDYGSADTSDVTPVPAADVSSAATSNADLSFKMDKDYKYSNPETSVKLSYPRIIMLLQKLISQNPTSNRTEVLKQLEAATSKQEVQTIINNSKLRLASNYVMGGKTKKRKGRKGGKTMRR